MLSKTVIYNCLMLDILSVFFSGHTDFCSCHFKCPVLRAGVSSSFSVAYTFVVTMCSKTEETVGCSQQDGVR